MTNQSTLAQAFSTTHGSPIYTYGLGPLATQTTIRRYKAKKSYYSRALVIFSTIISLLTKTYSPYSGLYSPTSLVPFSFLTATTTCQLKNPGAILSVKLKAFYARHSILWSYNFTLPTSRKLHPTFSVTQLSSSNLQRKLRLQFRAR
jgi:hypothetical protein